MSIFFHNTFVNIRPFKSSDKAKKEVAVKMHCSNGLPTAFPVNLFSIQVVEIIYLPSVEQ